MQCLLHRDLDTIDPGAAVRPGSRSGVRNNVWEDHPEESMGWFETSPGLQGQVDFGSFMFSWVHRHALLVILDHSRLLWLQFLSSPDREALSVGWKEHWTGCCTTATSFTHKAAVRQGIRTGLGWARFRPIMSIDATGV